MDGFFLHQLLEAEQQVAQLQDKERELEVCLEATRSQIREKDTQLEEQKRRERDLLTTITEYVRTGCRKHIILSVAMVIIFTLCTKRQ